MIRKLSLSSLCPFFPFLIIVLILIAMRSETIKAQGNQSQKDIFQLLQSPNSNNNSNEGSVKIFQDADIVTAVQRHLYELQKTNGIPGYRLRLYSGGGINAREESTQTRSTFLNHFPDIECYWVFVSPDYKVYAGDFRTKSEALKLLYRVKPFFPKASPFPVETTIRFPKLSGNNQ